ncbi:hypothetical protein V502_07829 [Pseudogymnoascus sp. VKM F-4520 (FW-2644)]|nr:hypothetical protein V502_07829 [Pseudogymnoascus sp. VKM F-4520 (FW-2644)]
MLALDRGNAEAEFGAALVHIMFALAARCIMHNSSTPSTASNTAEPPGERWAKKANDMIFRNLGMPNVQNLMALVLLCEYESRYGQNSTVFMLSGCCFRMAQLLRLNTEPEVESTTHLSTVTQITECESRRRLMWSCYILDVLVGSGVESLIMSSKALPNVKVPCNNDAYLLQKEPSTGYLLPDGILLVDSLPAESLGLEAYFVYVISLREQILRRVLRPDNREHRYEPAILEKTALRQTKNAILIASLCRLLKDFGFSEILNAWRQKLDLVLSSRLQPSQDAPEFEYLHFMTTFQQAWKEISWPKPPQHENDHFEGSTTATLQTQAGSNTDESSRLGYQLSQINETGIVAEGSFGIPNEQISTQTADQYLQMAEDMGDYLTWEPFQIDLSGTNNFIYQ